MNKKVTRRAMLKSAACGFGSLALTGLCQQTVAASSRLLYQRRPMFPAKAKRVIFIFMAESEWVHELINNKIFQ